MGVQEVLTNPEKFLGSNYLQVLEFWSFVDTLNGDKIIEINKRFASLDLEFLLRSMKERLECYDNLSWRVSHYVWIAVDDTIGFPSFCLATKELTGDSNNKVFYNIITSQ